MALPTLKFQMAFGNRPGDASFAWTDVPGVQDVSYSRGQPNEYDRIETGESRVNIGDPGSRLDPNNAGVLLNLVSNPSFEVDTAGWEEWIQAGSPTATIARSTAAALYGSASMLVTVQRTADGWTDYGPTLIPVTAGKQYTYSAYVKNASGTRTLAIELDFHDAGGTAISFTQADTGGAASSSVWTRLTVTVTAPVGAVGARLWVGGASSPGLVGDAFYVDGVQLEQGATATAYCDGAQDNCRWAGTANASQSYRGGPHYPNVKRMRPIRALINIGGTDYPLFQHFVERLPRTVSVGTVWTERDLTGVDAFAWFALAGLRGQSYASEASGTRWDNVLDDVSWPAGRRSTDAGSSTLAASTFDPDDGAKALEHLLDIVSSENGFGFMDAAGNARFIERHTAITDTTIVATFADDRSLATGSYTGALPYVGLQPESTEIVNDYAGKRADGGGTVQVAYDTSSIADYGPRSEELTFLLSTDAAVQDAIRWRISQTKDPYERIDGITVMPGDDLTKWVALLGLEVGDRVRVVEWPPGYQAPVETTFLIRHLAVSLPVGLVGASFTFQLTPSAADAWKILDDADRGRLDFNKLAY